jgi:hypothetical protein
MTTSPASPLTPAPQPTLAPIAPAPAAPIAAAPRPHAAAPALDAGWQRWVAEQRLRGCTVESMVQTMAGAGHDRAAAARAIAAIEASGAYEAALALQQRLAKLEAVALNLQSLWASDPAYRTVDKRDVAQLGDDEFAEKYVRGCRPVVLTGHTRDWPAMRCWSAQDLKARFGHLEVDVQAERNADPNYEENKLARTKRVNLGAFVDQVVAGGATNDYYLTANNELLRRPEFSPLLADVGSLPPLTDRAQLAERSSFWFGPAGTVTPLHHDTLMLFHTQVVGRKRWRFVSPLEWTRVYNHRHVFSEVDLERPDAGRWPRFEEASVLEVVVEPGETMFLPLGWWHQVASLDMSLSFSYSCLAVPNQFGYPDPALPPRPAAAPGIALPPAPPRSEPATLAEAMHGELRDAIAQPGTAGGVEARFADGSRMRLRSDERGVELQVQPEGSRAAHYAERLAGVARDGAGYRCEFRDGSSIMIVPG